jgi:phage shock protein PspC (stress-responsive transcriptional regulator)
MKKTLTANISGTVFHIEEDAYEQLSRYLATIRGQFASTEGRDEIMADIEARIAELFTELLGGTRSVVTIADVEQVMRTMGRPEDYAGEGTNDQGPTGAQQDPGFQQGSGRKRLFRHPLDKWVGGVLGGIGAYFGTDPLWLRILFIVLFIFGLGSPILIYLILWILVPMADSAAERLMMEGEPVTVDNLKRAFEEGADRMKRGAEQMAREADELGRKWSSEQGRQRQREAFSGVERFAQGIVGVLAKIVGFLMLIGGAAITIALLGLLIGGGTITYDSIIGLGDIAMFDLASVVFDSAQQGMWFTICFVLLALIPAIGAFIGGLRLLTGLRAPQWMGWMMGTAWMAAMVVVIIIGIRLGNDMGHDQRIIEEVPLAQPAGQTLYLGADDMRGLGHEWSMKLDDGRVDWDMDGLRLKPDSIHIAWAELDVKPSPDSLFHLLVHRRGHGRSDKMATARASHIHYNYAQQDSLVLFSPWVNIPANDKLRAQCVRFVVQVPVGRAVHFQGGVGFLLDDVKNVTNTWDEDMVGQTWTMTTNGLSSSVRPEDIPDDLPLPNGNEQDKPSAPVNTTVQNRSERQPVPATLPNIISLLDLSDH